MRTHLGPSVSLSAIVVRACDYCHGKREFGKPCQWCGSNVPAKVTDLGIIASNQKSWIKRVKWNLWQYRAAQRRIRKLNEELIRDTRL